jgi:hypothetical protein
VSEIRLAPPKPAPPERCIHNLLKGTCATCLPPQRPTRAPVKRDPTRHSAPALGSLSDDGIAVVRTARGREHCGVERLDKDTTFVHIDGPGFLWAFEEILKRAPNLRTIQLIPSAHAKLRGHLELCAARGVEVVRGHYKPELAWEDDRIVNPQYEPQRRFLRTMGGDQRRLFDELLAMGFESATIAARYFCLNDEPYAPMRVLVDEYDYSKGHVSIISVKVLSVLHYLDDTTVVGDAARLAAATMRARVGRLRPYLASADLRRRLAEEMGLPALPATLPLARAETLKAVLKAKRDGRIAAIRAEHPRDHEALVLRFGLEEVGVYRTLLEVGQRMGGITRERARQLEERGLSLLGISE